MLYSHTIKLIKTYDGMDGLKTGYTKEAGYCLTATAKKNNMRLIGVIMGEETSAGRNEDMAKMLDYGFNLYTVNQFLTKDTKVGTIDNDKSKNGKVNVVPVQDINVLKKKGSKDRKLTYKLDVTKEDLPIKKGDIIGKLNIYENNRKLYTIDVTTNKNMEKANILELLLRNIEDTFTGDNVM